ncbi:hypothetical protein [Geminisphaera colitermitum]|uniref:hypothetical protein n=1 Tax=Geminisphaera colitermitum TaxID=1148786 RepID=UPI000158C56F|nr:hypothetical protein [Geminisphaera colitermitum]
MNNTALVTVAATGFSVAFFHAVIPTHWLPFVLVSRARGWSRTKTLGVAAFAGLGHVLLTSLLGLAIAWFGFQLNHRLGHMFPWLVGGFLFAVGLYYAWRQLRGRGVCHHHPPGGQHQPGPECGHEDEFADGEDADGSNAHVEGHGTQAGESHWEHELKESPLAGPERVHTSDWAAAGGLFVMLTLSPCETFLPVYLSGSQFGWMGFFVLSVILAVGALGGMLLFTWLTLMGLERVNLRRFERMESGLLAVLFMILGVLVVIVERGHGH